MRERQPEMRRRKDTPPYLRRGIASEVGRGIPTAPHLRAILFTALVLASSLAPLTTDAAQPLPDVLDLATAQAIALSEHPSIDLAEARVRQAKERYNIVRASFLPTIGVGGSWTGTELPDRYFESDLPSFSESQAAWDEANGSWSSGDLIDNYLSSPLSDLGEAWQDGDLTQYLLQNGSEPHDPVVSEAQLRKLRDQLQSRQPLTEAEAEDIADSLRASYLDATIGDTPTFYSVGAHASWMVFDGFSRMFRRAAALHGEERSVASQRDAERLLLGAVAAAYCQAQYAREEVAIAQADLEFSERLLQDASRGKEAGLRAEDDVLDFTVKRNASESVLIETRRKYRLSLHALATVLALPDDGIPETVQLSPLPASPPEEGALPDVEQEIEYALAHRPDLVAGRASSAARRADKGTAKSTYYPSVWLAGGYDALRDEDINFTEEDFGWNVSLLVSMEVFRGGARVASVNERAAAQVAAEAAVFQNELEAIKEVRDAASSLASAGEQFDLQKRNLSYVERFRDLVEMQYRTGTAQALKLHDAQRKLVSAQKRHASAQVSWHAAWHALQQATARSLEATAKVSKESNAQP